MAAAPMRTRAYSAVVWPASPARRSVRATGPGRVGAGHQPGLEQDEGNEHGGLLAERCAEGRRRGIEEAPRSTGDGAGSRSGGEGGKRSQQHRHDGEEGEGRERAEHEREEELDRHPASRFLAAATPSRAAHRRRRGRATRPAAPRSARWPRARRRAAAPASPSIGHRVERIGEPLAAAGAVEDRRPARRRCRPSVVAGQGLDGEVDVEAGPDAEAEEVDDLGSLVDELRASRAT